MHTFANANVRAAQAISLLPVAVEPHTENHEHYPAGGANASDERRLPHHMRNLRPRVSVLTDVHHLAGRVCKTGGGKRFSFIINSNCSSDDKQWTLGK